MNSTNRLYLESLVIEAKGRLTVPYLKNTLNMAIYTPRGLKIRITIPYAFALMTRLSPEITPFRILKTAESLASLHSTLVFITGIICFIMRLSPLTIGLFVWAIHLLGTYMQTLRSLPGVLAISTLHSYISGFGLSSLTIFIVGFYSVGWRGIFAFFLAKFIAGTCCASFLFWKAIRKSGLSPHEVVFFDAYVIHALKCGKTTDINLSDTEMFKEYWYPTFEKFALEWPQIVQRFTDD
jgi:hypothetical protein